MRSGTSFFNATVYRKNFLRFWPIWALSLAIWGLILPIRGLMSLNSPTMGDNAPAIVGFARGVGDLGGLPALVCALLLGVLTAMAVCSHLYSARSANFMGALPIRREGLFLSHWLAGVTMLIAPNAMIALLTFLVEAAGGAVMLPPLLFWFVSLSVMELFFYSYAVCLGMFAGHLLALPAYYGIFNALPSAIYALLTWVMELFYYGFDSFPSGTYTVVQWLTPVALFSSVGMSRFVSDSQTGYEFRLYGEDALVVYGIVALVLTGIALLVYRRRQLERAGDVVAVKVMRPVFKYGVGACSGLFFGFLTSQILYTDTVGLMVAIALWGVAGYFVAQMLLEKSVRVLKYWRGCAALLAAFLLLFAVVGFDLTGFESRVPQLDEVASVRISGLRAIPQDDGVSNLSRAEIADPELIALTVALHEAILEQWEDPSLVPVNAYANQRFSVRYTLDNGQVMSRNYSGLSFGPKAAALAQQILDNRELKAQSYGFARVAQVEGQGAVLHTATLEDDNGYIEFGGGAAKALWEAVQEDFAAGRLGNHRLRTLDDKWSSYPLISFSWKGFPQSTYVETVGNVEIHEDMDMSSYFYMSVTVPATATSTWAVVKEYSQSKDVLSSKDLAAGVTP